MLVVSLALARQQDYNMPVTRLLQCTGRNVVGILLLLRTVEFYCCQLATDTDRDLPAPLINAVPVILRQANYAMHLHLMCNHSFLI